jgi:hypothetical protein
LKSIEIKVGNHVIKVGENNFQIEYSVKTNDNNIYSGSFGAPDKDKKEAVFNHIYDLTGVLVSTN